MRNWTKVEYKGLYWIGELKDYNMWKKEGTTLVSKYKGAILGAHKETKGLVGFFGENEMITPVSIGEGASSNSQFSLPCENYFHTISNIYSCT